ncbi:MAG: putative lipid II flippase FtsW [Propionibacteriaceae bacterium]|nr:putative lipid II flippase FtsW [Propionibacteriaceae bacterium]
MAILTPSRPPRPSGRTKRPAQQTTLAGRAAGWLDHPMADTVMVLVPTMILLGLGFLMVWSASTVYGHSQFGDAFFFIRRHAVFLVAALVAGFVASRIPTDRLRVLAWVFYALAGVLLCLTFVPGLGYGVGGNKNWINLGGEGSMLRLQPAEFAKLSLVVWGSAVLANKRRLLDQPKHLLIPFVPFGLLLVGLVVLQRDLGTAMVLGAMVLAILFCVGASWRVLGSMILAVAVAVAGLVALNTSRINRILGFLDPSADPTGINHQPLQALYGLASGGWLGVGLGRSRQKWGSLSEAHTDYVLAVVGEELGLMGTLMVIVLFLILAWGGMRIALRSSTFFSRLVASGITTWLLLQALVNIMVVLRLLPVLGVPLPFLSYGGSALVANVIAVGILVACAREEPAAKVWLRRRRKAQAQRPRLSAILPTRRRS